MVNSNFQMSVSAAVSLLSIAGGIGGIYIGLDHRITAVEYIVAPYQGVPIGQRLADLAEGQQAAKRRSKNNFDAITRLSRMLCKSDDPIRQGACRAQQMDDLLADVKPDPPQ